MEIHSFVPRFKSLRWAISSSIYSRPFDRFLISGFPISLPTGKTRARQIAQFLSRYFRDFPQPSINIYDVGAGCGILGLNVLNILKEEEFYLYQILTWHILDPSMGRVSQIQQNPEFQAHTHHIQISHGDARAIPATADGVILSVALSTLPARHVVSHHGVCHEAIIRSEIDNDLEWTDTAVYPAITRYADAVKTYYATGGEELIPDAETILRHTTEEWTIVNASTDTGWHPKELEQAADWAQHTTHNHTFNFSGLVTATINECIKKVLPRHGFVLLEDIGEAISGNVSVSKLMTHYKTSCGFRLPFNLMARWIHSLFGHKVMTSQFKESTLQLQLIVPQEHSLTTTEFDTLFPNIGNESIHHLLKNLRTIRAQDEYQVMLNTGYSQLLPDERHDYDLNLCIAIDLMARHSSKLALPYIDAAISQMGHLAIKALWLKASIHRTQLNYELAETLLLSILDTVVYPPAVVDLIRIYQDTRRHALAAEIMGRYYDHLGKNWNSITPLIGHTHDH